MPYLFFGLIAYPIWLGKHFLKLGADVNWQTPYYKPLIGMLYGNGIDNFLIHNVLIWFLACLMMAEILLFLVLKMFKSREKILLAISVLFVIGYVNSMFHHIRLPFGLDVSLVAVFLLGTGFIFRDRILNYNPNLIHLIVLGLLGVSIALINGSVDMNYNRYENPLLFLLTAFSGSAFYLGFSRKIPSIRLLEYVGENSLFLFGVQVISFSMMSLVFRFMGVHVYGINNLLAILFSVVGLLISVGLSVVINRYGYSYLSGKF